MSEVGEDRRIRENVGRALVRAIAALEAIEASAAFERDIVRLLLAVYRRRLRAIIGTAPAWAGNRIFEAGHGIPDPRAALFGEN